MPLPVLRRLTWAVAIGIVLLGLVLRLASWQAARGYGIVADEKEYVVPAEMLTRTGHYTDTFFTLGTTWTRVPLTSLLLALAFSTQPALPAGASPTDGALMADRYAAGNLALCLVSTALIPLVMLLAAWAFPARARPAALLAGALVACYPPLINNAAQHMLAEPLFLTLSFAALAALVRWQPRARAWPWLVVSGLLLGLAALARPAALTLVPFVFLWLGVVAWSAGRHDRAAPSARAWAARGRRLFAALGAGALLLVAFLFAVSPWSAYNYLTYGRFILLDTTWWVHLWDSNNYDNVNLYAILSQVPNPADRDARAMHESLALIAAHPDRFVQAALRRLGSQWHLELLSALKPNPWDLTQRDADVPQVIPTDAAFLLASLVGLAGLAGLVWRSPRDQAGRVRLALVLYIAPVLITGVVVEQESRYRLPAATALLIFASGLLVTADWARLGNVRGWGAHLRRHPRVAALALLLCAWVLVGALAPQIPRAVRALTLAWFAEQATGASQAGADAAAVAALPTSFWPYRHAADHARLAGQDAEARRLFAAAVLARPGNDDNRGVLGQADLLARHPDWPLTPDEADSLDRTVDDMRGPIWTEFAPTPRAALSLGTDRDWGYIQGFLRSDHSGPDTFRWCGGRCRVRLPAPPDALPAGAIRLRLAAPALPGLARVPITIRVAGATPIQVDVEPRWADYTLPLNPPVPGDLDVSFDSPVYMPRALDPASRDDRLLGVGVQSVERVPRGEDAGH